MVCIIILFKFFSFNFDSLFNQIFRWWKFWYFILEIFLFFFCIHFIFIWFTFIRIRININLHMWQRYKSINWCLWSNICNFLPIHFIWNINTIILRSNRCCMSNKIKMSLISWIKWCYFWHLISSTPKWSITRCQCIWRKTIKKLFNLIHKTLLK